MKKVFATSEGITNMAEQATETFKTEHYKWMRHGEDAVMTNGSLPRKFRAKNEGNGLSHLWMNGWVYGAAAEPFDTECKQALRALVGPPPWETRALIDEAVNGIAEMIQQDDAAESPAGTITLESIDQLCALSNEAEHGFAELKAIAVRLVEERDAALSQFGRAERDRLEIIRIQTEMLDEAGISANGPGVTWRVETALGELHRERTTLAEVVKANEQTKRERDLAIKERDTAIEERDVARNLDRHQRELINILASERNRANEVRKYAEEQNAKLIAENAELRTRASSIEAAFILANDIAIRGKDRSSLLQAIAGTLNEIGCESEAASALVCPWEEPMHFHHDGCPSCMEVTGPENASEGGIRLLTPPDYDPNDVKFSDDDVRGFKAKLATSFGGLDERLKKLELTLTVNESSKPSAFEQAQSVREIVYEEFTGIVKGMEFRMTTMIPPPIHTVTTNVSSDGNADTIQSAEVQS